MKSLKPLKMEDKTRKKGLRNNKALLGFSMIQGLVPFILFLTDGIIFYKGFDMKGKKKHEIM